MVSKITNELTNAILSIEDLNGRKVEYNKVEIKNYIDEKSPYLNEINVGCFVDDKKLSVRDKKVTYKCACGYVSTIYLKKYLIKPRLVCNHCREDEEKRKNHSLFFKTGVQKKIIDKKPKQVYDFENESGDFKQKYYNKHFTEKEFYDILPLIKSIEGVTLEGKDVKYLEHENVKNRSKYAPYVLIDGVHYKFEKVYVKCPQCGTVYKISDSRSKKEKFNKGLVCINCSFANKRYPIQWYKTKFGDRIKYQSKTELKLINECEVKNIRIINGPKVPYKFNGSWHTYFIDFELSELNKLIETKGNHIWHRQNIESGKWSAKECAGREYAKENNKEYFLLFYDDIDNFINSHI